MTNFRYKFAMFSRQLIAITLLYTSYVSSIPVIPLRLRHYYPFCKHCLRCAKTVADVIQSNHSYNSVRPVLIRLCEDIMSDIKLQGRVLCPGLVDTYAPPSLRIASQAVFAPAELCERLEFCPRASNRQNIGDVSHGVIRALSVEERKMKLGRNHMSDDDDMSVDQLQPIRILQLSDIHLDRLYQEGTATDCGLFICCRNGLNGTGRAGRYGEYKCDLPLATLGLLTKHLRDLDPQPDFVIYTGDNPTHDIWEKTLQGQTESSRFLVDFLSKNLPNQTIYPAIGNHETFPDNFYYPPLYGNFTAAIADFWQRWVAFPENALQTVRAGGYYTMLIRPGLRLMSLNTEFGYQLNFYTLLNDQTSQYFEHHRWIESTLAEAARNGEKVLVIGHIPPGQVTSIESFGDFYVPIAAEYKDIIVGQIFGHSHEDQFEVVQFDGLPAGVVYIAPSVTPFPHINPSYRIYHMDPKTYDIIDYEQYHIDLQEANSLAEQNRSEEIKWQLAYTAKNEYSLPDLTPASWWKLTEKFEEDQQLFRKYLANKRGRSSKEDNCLEECKRFVICSARSASKKQLLRCLT